VCHNVCGLVRARSSRWAVRVEGAGRGIRNALAALRPQKKWRLPAVLPPGRRRSPTAVIVAR